MADVLIRDLKKSYGNTAILRGIDIVVPDGAFVALVGPSGCGKSTLLRSIAGLEEVNSGEILIGGRVVNDVPPKHRDVAMVFQNYALYPHLTVRENMSFSLKLRGVDTAGIQREVERAAGILGLEAMLDRLPRQLSGGQRQRVAMGRAIVRNPQVFLFDEPLSNLDAKLRVQMRSEIKALQKRLGTTTVYVTHDQMEAMTMADIVVIMQDGKVVQAAAPLALYDRPDNLFVAGFIGSPVMNLIEGVLQRDATGTWLNTDNLRIRLDETVGASHGSKVVCGIRPEHLDWTETSDTSDCLTGVITLVEPTGPETHVTVAMAGGQKMVAVIPQRHDFVPGNPLSLRPRPGHIHLFDALSTQRLNGH